MGINDNNTTELMAHNSGVQIAKPWNLFPLILEGDSKLIISLAIKIQNGTPTSKIAQSWRLDLLLQLLTRELNNAASITFHHVRRNSNSLENIIENEGVPSKSHLYEIDINSATSPDL